MASYALTEHFNYFFRRLNPSSTFEQRAASEHRSIIGLIEDPNGLASALSPKCFLQGSYRQQTAIYSINDVDIVALCALWQPGSGAGAGRTWDRQAIFDIIAAPLLNDGRYKDKVHYRQTSMCIKVDLDIKIEILPVVYKAGNYDSDQEPFRLYRPETNHWEDGYARYHQTWLTWKNRPEKTNGNFKPAIKVMKHLRSLFSSDAVSFHIECLLFSLPDYLFIGRPADYIPAILNYIATIPAETWWVTEIKTPCGERNLFTTSEWDIFSWMQFHNMLVTWNKVAQLANQVTDQDAAIKAWQILLGEEFLPRQIS